MKTGLLLILLSSVLFAFSSTDIIHLYENNFSKKELLKIKKIDEYYIILSSTIDFGHNENQKLNLIAKNLLFKYFKKRDNKITTILLKEFKNATTWKKENRIYLLSFVKESNITPEYGTSNNSNQSAVLENEIECLEQMKNKTLLIHQQLKSLYFQKGDMENYTKEVDKLMELKFKGL